jgi:signal transducer and activator of transcription 5B
VADLNHLVYLYPDISKDIPFAKYYTPFQDNQPATNNGYVKPVLVTHVPGLSAASYPNTPQHSYLQSPDPSRDTPSVASSYAGSTATTATTGGPAMDYLDQLDDCNIDFNGLVNFNELMQGYKQ